MEKYNKFWVKIVDAINRMMSVNNEYHLVEIAEKEFKEYFGLEPSHVRLYESAAVARKVVESIAIPDRKAKEYALAMGAKYVVLETVVFESEGYCKNENAVSPIVFSEVTREEDTYCVVNRVKLVEKLE